jgi:nitroreductase
MDFYSVIENRKSIKKYKSTELQKDKIGRMINAAMMSPSWKNKTSYKFILVDDKNSKEQLAGTIMNDTKDASQSIQEAPMCAVVVADPGESGNMAEREYYLVDSAIAMEHFMLAATAEGYGTCWIASIDEDKIRDILSIPKDFRVVAMTPIGEIAEDKQHNPMKKVNDYIFLNSWNESYAENIKH